MTTLNDGKRRAGRVFFVSLIITTVFLAGAHTYAAVSEEAAIDYLKEFAKIGIDSTQSLVSDALRGIGFSVVKFLATAADALYKGLIQIYDTVTFSYGSEITALARKYSVLYKSLFIVSVTCFGLYMLMGKKQSLNTINCLIIMALIISAMPLMMNKVGDLTVSSSEYVMSKWNTGANRTKVSSIAGTTINSNIVDMNKVDKTLNISKVKSNVNKVKGYNDLSQNAWKTLKINAVMDYEDDEVINTAHENIWKNRLVEKSDGGYKLEKMSGFMGMDSLNSYYYRYQVTGWINIFVQLGTMVILFIFISIRAAKLVIDLALSMIYTPFIAVTDLTTGQRIKEAIKDIIAHFAALFFIAALMGVYFVAFSFIQSSDMGIFPKLCFHIAIVWAIIDGPNILERIFGVDIGYGGVWKAALGIKAGTDMARGAAGMAAGAGKAAGKAVGGLAKAGTKTAQGLGTGILGKEGMKDLSRKADSIRDNLAKRKDDIGKNVSEATGNRGVIGAVNKAHDKAAAERFGLGEGFESGYAPFKEQNRSDESAVSKGSVSSPLDRNGTSASPERDISEAGTPIQKETESRRFTGGRSSERRDVSGRSPAGSGHSVKSSYGADRPVRNGSPAASGGSAGGDRPESVSRPTDRPVSRMGADTASPLQSAVGSGSSSGSRLSEKRDMARSYTGSGSSAGGARSESVSRPAGRPVGRASGGAMLHQASMYEMDNIKNQSEYERNRLEEMNRRE